MLKTFFNPIFILFVFMIIFNGCAPMPGPAEDVDYNSVELQELEALEKIQYTLHQMDGIDAALYFSKEDFTLLVHKSFEDFKTHFAQLDSPSFSKVTFENIRLHLSNQKVSSQVRFSFEIDALKAKVFGHLHADHRLQAGRDTFVLNTNFNEIVLDSIEEVESLKESSDKKEIVGTAIKSFMHILNVEISNTPLQIPVDMNILSNINGKDIASSPEFKLQSSRAVYMQTKMEVYLPYVSEVGVLFLGASKTVPAKKAVKAKVLSDIRDDVKKSIDLSLMENIGVSFDTLQKYSSYYVSRKYLSKQMNLSLKTMDLRMINKFFLKIPEEKRYLQKEIYFFNKDALPSCEGVKKQCSKLLDVCVKNCESKFGVHHCEQCDTITNPFEHVRCMSKIEACKRKEERNIYECHKRENRCEADNNLILAACKKKNLEYIAECKEKKQRVQFVNDEIAIAKLHLTFDVYSSYAAQHIRQMIFDKGLDTLEVIRDTHISADSRIGLELFENKANEINCSLGQEGAVLIHSKNDKTQEKKVLPLSVQRAENGAMLLKAVSKQNFLTSQLNNPPYEKLMKTKGFSLQCTYQGMPMQAVEGERLLSKRDVPYGLNALFGEVELPFEEEFTFMISPIRLGDDILLYPTMETDAIGFSRQAHFY